jgi:hypothetical protein
VCNLILTYMYSMHSDLPLNPGVTILEFMLKLNSKIKFSLKEITFPLEKGGWLGPNSN